MVSDKIMYGNGMTRVFANLNDLLEPLRELKDFNSMGYKGVIFNDRNDDMSEAENILKKKKYTFVNIYTDEKNNDSQFILSTGMIPDEYDFVIINGEINENWKICDKRVDMLIINGKEVNRTIFLRNLIHNDVFTVGIKAHGDLNFLDVKIMRSEERNFSIRRRIGSRLTEADKESIVNELNVKDEYRIKANWDEVLTSLKKVGYIIKEDGNSCIINMPKDDSLIKQFQWEPLNIDKVFKRDKIKLEKKKLILSPNESRNSVVMNNLLNATPHNKLLLVKDSCIDKPLYGKNFTDDLMKERKMNLRILSEKLSILSYSEFSDRIAHNYDELLINNIDSIISEDIDWVFEDYLYNNSHKLGFAIQYLYLTYSKNNIQFACSRESIDRFSRVKSVNLLKYFEVFDYTKDESVSGN